MSNNDVSNEKRIKDVCKWVAKRLLRVVHSDKNGDKKVSFDLFMENYNKILDNYFKDQDHVKDSDLKEILKKNGALPCGLAGNFLSLSRLVENKKQARDFADLVNPMFRHEKDYLDFVRKWEINDPSINNPNFTQSSADKELNRIIDERVKKFTENGKNPMNINYYNDINMARFFANPMSLNQFVIDQDHAKKYINLWLDLAEKRFKASSKKPINTELRTQKETFDQLAKNEKINNLARKYKVDVSFISGLYPSEHGMIVNCLASRLDSLADVYIDQIDIRMQTDIFNWRTLDFWYEQEKEYEESKLGKFRNEFNKKLKARIENICKNKKVDSINYDEFIKLYNEELNNISDLDEDELSRIREKGALSTNDLHSVLEKVSVSNFLQYNMIRNLVAQDFKIDYRLNFETRDFFGKTMNKIVGENKKDYEKKINDLKEKYKNQYTSEEFDKIFAYEKNLVNNALDQNNIYSADFFVLQIDCRAKLNSKETVYNINDEKFQAAIAITMLIKNVPDKKFDSVDKFLDNYKITIEEFQKRFSYESEQLSTLQSNSPYIAVWLDHLKARLESKSTAPFKSTYSLETADSLNNTVVEEVSNLISSFGFGNVTKDMVRKFALGYKNSYEYKQAAYALENGYLEFRDVWIQKLKNVITKEAFIEFNKKELEAGSKARLMQTVNSSRYPIVYEKFGNNYTKVNEIFKVEIDSIRQAAKNGSSKDVDYWFNVIEARLAYNLDLDKPYDWDKSPRCKFAGYVATLIWEFEDKFGQRMSFDDFQTLLSEDAANIKDTLYRYGSAPGVLEQVSETASNKINSVAGSSFMESKQNLANEAQDLVIAVKNMFRYNKNFAHLLKNDPYIKNYIELLKKELDVDISESYTSINFSLLSFKTLTNISQGVEAKDLKKAIENRTSENIKMVNKFINENKKYSDILEEKWGMGGNNPKGFLLLQASFGLPKNLMESNINWVKSCCGIVEKGKPENHKPELQKDVNTVAEQNKIDENRFNIQANIQSEETQVNTEEINKQNKNEAEHEVNANMDMNDEETKNDENQVPAVTEEENTVDNNNNDSRDNVEDGYSTEEDSHDENPAKEDNKKDKKIIDKLADSILDTETDLGKVKADLQKDEKQANVAIWKAMTKIENELEDIDKNAANGQDGLTEANINDTIKKLTRLTEVSFDETERRTELLDKAKDLKPGGFMTFLRTLKNIFIGKGISWSRAKTELYKENVNSFSKIFEKLRNANNDKRTPKPNDKRVDVEH